MRDMTVVEFKTNAWKTPEAADNYHRATASAAGEQTLFSLLRHDLYRKYLYRYISPGQKVLDLGCGSGLISSALHDDGYVVVGCDVSEGMLARFRAEMGSRKIELRVGDGFDIPAADREFDAVISRMFIQHFPNWRDILREKARVTKDGGIIYFDFGNQEHLDQAPGIESASLQYPYSRDVNDQLRHYGVCTSAEMKSTASELNLDVLQIIPHGLFLLNAQFWTKSGPAEAAAFTAQLNEHLKAPDVAKFLVFMEEEFVSKLPPSATYGNIVVLKKRTSSGPPHGDLAMPKPQSLVRRIGMRLATALLRGSRKS